MYVTCLLFLPLLNCNASSSIPFCFDVVVGNVCMGERSSLTSHHDKQLSSQDPFRDSLQEHATVHSPVVAGSIVLKQSIPKMYAFFKEIFL